MAYGLSGLGGGWRQAGRGLPYMESLRNETLSDALAQGRGARAGAMRMAGDDPSLAASAGLSSLMQGQSNASHTLARAHLQQMALRQQFLQQKKLMKYQQELQRGNPLMGALGSIGGMALGSFLGPLGASAGSALGGSLFGGGGGSVGTLGGQQDIYSYLNTLYGGGDY